MTKRRNGGGSDAPPEGGQGDLFGTFDLPPLKPAAKAKAAPAPAPAPKVRAVPAPPVPAAPPPVEELAPEPPRAPAAPRVLTVGELTRQIKQTLEARYPKVMVRGEVSGYRGPNARGHVYFTLKDASASIDAKLWATQAARLKFGLREGLAVVAEGSVDVYEPQGRYSLIVSKLEPEGEGALALAFQQLKERLAAEGLIGEGRIRPPRPVPFLPRRIGVVTSRTGAALQDFLRVLHARNPRASVLLCDARVQGEGSAADVVRAIERLQKTDIDVLVVTRGGGSVEDLWTFNEESVARAIWACRVPVVSAIGHEIDFTIADFVADLRCPTPSAAAERLAPVLADLTLTLATHESRLRGAVARRVLEARAELRAEAGQLADPRRMLGQQRLRLNDAAERLERALRPDVRARREALALLGARLERQRPEARLAEQRQRLVKLHERLRDALRVSVAARRAQGAEAHLRLQRATPAARVAALRTELGGQAARLAQLERGALARQLTHFGTLAGRLDAMSPLKVMRRGYAVTFRQADGRLVRGMEDVQVGDRLGIKYAHDGSRTLQQCAEIEVEVTAVKGPTDC